ncbi:transketolase [Parachlamydia acanthamoebae UV-7]|uniref:Transketolase n=2 Tax=Parachlamydia acanthamoebae TaxID=83552 RepID=F8KX79_PARAV|nr:transketolase [Parachlamydia acanthamoebae]CCB85546.1 transketolase [Parachlamydia acanthamoebae UV-7]
MEKKILDPNLKQILSKIANTIRGLSMDAVQKANSGHPGLPMGCAEIGAYLWGHPLQQNPKDSKWMNRDRFILSAGHGSMLLYSCLHLAGYQVTLEDIKNFRQLHSKTPGHPESLDTDGVETTTGPLGQGLGNGVGQALGLKLLEARFNTPKQKILNPKVFVLMGDGCVMEGVTSEVSAFAGHLQLDNLIAIYDANHVTLDGPLQESGSENTFERYKSYGWDVYEIDGNDLDELHTTISHIRENQTKPTLIIAHTIIGKGSPHKAGTSQAHGSPLGVEEVKASKIALGIPEEPFFVPQAVYDFFKVRQKQQAQVEEDWKKEFEEWAKTNPQLLKEMEIMIHKKLPVNLEEQLKAIEIKSPVAGRKASQVVLEKLADLLPFLYGGSADLSVSDLTMIQQFPIVTPGNFKGRNIKFGIREFGMATMATGMSQTGMIIPFVGTFLTFSDYMRNAIRLASLMRQQVIYQFTHDSIFLGEDGPTHQPIEHLAALRAMPQLHVIRPADANEVRMAWIAALNYKGPTALILSRQNLPTLDSTNVPYSEGVARGAYIIKKEVSSPPNFTLIATGSEVSLALDVSKELEKIGKSVRVISMPCWELYEKQNPEYKESIFGGDLGQRVSIEAGVEQGWHKYIGRSGIAISMESYGASAPASALATEFGFTVNAILEQIL